MEGLRLLCFSLHWYIRLVLLKMDMREWNLVKNLLSQIVLKDMEVRHIVFVSMEHSLRF